VHLETPNYTVTRMRHDDLNKTEPLPASYNLVEAPAEEQKAAGTSEPAAPRPEAAVKAITPQQPAPIPVAREMRQEPQPQSKAAQVEKASIIGKIFGWFKSKPAQEAPVADAARPVASHGPRRGRPDREGPRREREVRPMQQGGQRQRQEPPPQGQRDGGRHRSEQQRQEPRRQEPPQQQRQHPQRDQMQGESRPPSLPQQPGREHGEQQREGRGRRRRRGGRDRYEQRQPEAGGSQPPARDQQAQREPNRPEAERPAPTVEPVPAAYSPVAAAFPEPIAAAEVASYKAPPAVFETETVREFQPRETAPMAVSSGPGFAPAEPVKIEWPSDLKQVESDPEKIQTAQREVTEDQPMPRPKRVRPAAEPVGNEPLVQIETQASGPATPGTERKETALPG
jgi:ribonuclease E